MGSEREPITGELRRVMSHTTAAGCPLVELGEFEFAHRCDAIDAVHAALEAENAGLRAKLDEMADSMHETDAWKLGYDEGFANADDWMADNEDAMEEHGWVRLPLDADGVPIRVGDEVVGELDESTEPRKVTSLYLANDGWWVYIGGVGRRPDRYRHHHAPTVEDVLREFTDAIFEWAGKGGTVAEVGTWSDVAAEYAAKLRLAGDAE